MNQRLTLFGSKKYPTLQSSKTQILSNYDEHLFFKSLEELEYFEEYVRHIQRELKFVSEKEKASISSAKESIYTLMSKAQDINLKQRLDVWIKSVTLQENAVLKFVNVLQFSLGDSLSKLCEIFPVFNNENKKRNVILKEINKIQPKLIYEESKGRSGVHMAKAAELKCELNRQCEKFKIQHFNFQNDISLLNLSRTKYIKPSLKAIITSHAYNIAEMHQAAITTFSAFAEYSDLLLLTANNYTQHMQNGIKEIQSLSIVTKDENFS